MRWALVFAFLCSVLTGVVNAEAPGEIVDEHVLPRYELLAESSAALAAAAEADCSPTAPALRQAFHDAFDAWIGVSHLRFGPSEIDDRAFALAFWPDARGATPKALASLIRASDPVVTDPENFATVSIAARGFFALEYLLYGPQFAELGDAEYRCALIQAVTADIARNSVEILEDWQSGYGDLVRTAGQNQTYRSEDEAVRQFFTSLSTGLEFTADARLGRPLGTFERPRPNRAEARRSERSLRNVQVSLASTAELAALLSENEPNLLAQFDHAMDRAAALQDPVFAGVSEPGSRIRVEALQRAVNEVRQGVAEDLGAELGIEAGFNSLDGD